MISYKEAREKLYTAVLNSNSGEMSENSVRFQYDYLVITDHDVTSEDICTYGYQVLGLPRIGSRSPGSARRVTSISVSRWDDANMKAVPTHKLPSKTEGSYAAWKYEITCQSEESSDSGGHHTQALGSKSKPDNAPKTVKEAKKMAKERLACNVSVSTKSYTKTADPAYIEYSFPMKGKSSPDDDVKRYALPTGTTVSAEYEATSQVWNFTYYTTQPLSKAPDLVNTITSGLTVCGVEIKYTTVRLISFSTNAIMQDVYKEDGSFLRQEIVYEHQVELEQAYGNTSCIWADTSARLSHETDDANPVYYPICELLHGSKVFDAIYNGSNYQNRFFDKPRLLGAFEGLTTEVNGKDYTLQPGIDYNYITEPKVLTNKGFYYDPTKHKTSDIGRYYLELYDYTTWENLHLPTNIATVYTSDTYEVGADTTKHNV